MLKTCLLKTVNRHYNSPASSTADTSDFSSTTPPPSPDTKNEYLPAGTLEIPPTPKNSEEARAENFLQKLELGGEEIRYPEQCYQYWF